MTETTQKERTTADSELRQAQELLDIEFEERFHLSADENRNSVTYFQTTPSAEMVRFARALLKPRGED